MPIGSNVWAGVDVAANSGPEEASPVPCQDLVDRPLPSTRYHRAHPVGPNRGVKENWIRP